MIVRRRSYKDLVPVLLCILILGVVGFFIAINTAVPTSTLAPPPPVVPPEEVAPPVAPPAPAPALTASNLVTPHNGATGIELRPRFLWKAVPNAKGYELAVSLTSDFSDTVIDVSMGDTAYQLPPDLRYYQILEYDTLAPSTRYYWIVVAEPADPNTPVAYSGVWTFTTAPGLYVTGVEGTPAPEAPVAPPPTPEPLLPLMDSIIEEEAPLYFDWEDVEDFSGVTYTLQIAADINFTSLVLEKEGLTKSEYTLTEQKRKTLVPIEGEVAVYYWQVKAIDDAFNESEWSGTGSFTMFHLLPPPPSPMEEASMAVIDHLASLARSPSAKQILADFYDNFCHQEVYIWYNSNLVEINYDSQVSGLDFDFWEIARFPMPRDPRGGVFELPELFTTIFNESEEIIHPSQDGAAGYSEVTIALRWYVDPHTGQVKTTNPNALRLEAELLK